MPHSPDHSLSSIAYGSGQIHTHTQSPSPSPSQSQFFSNIPHSANPQSEIRNPQSPPPPLPPDLDSFDDLDSVRETIMEVELSNRLWLKAHRAATAPKDYNIPWINQVSQSLCRTMSWRKTLHFLEEKKNTPKPSPNTPPPAPALVSIDRRALDPLIRIYDEMLAEEAQAAKSGAPTGSADVPSATATAPQPAPLPSINPVPPLGPRTSPSATASACPSAPASLAASPLGPRTSPSATASTCPSATASLENAIPATPFSQAASPAPASSSVSDSAPASDVSGCATIRAVPVCPTLHRLLPDAPASTRSTESTSSIPSISVCNPQSEIRNQQSPSASIPRPHNPWFRNPFPAPDSS